MCLMTQAKIRTVRISGTVGDKETGEGEAGTATDLIKVMKSSFHDLKGIAW